MTSRQRKILIYAFVLGGFLACVADVVLACPKSGAKRTGSLYGQNRSSQRSNTAYAANAKRHQKPQQTLVVAAQGATQTTVATTTPAATPVPSLKSATENNYDELAVEHLLSAYQPAPEISEAKPAVKAAAPATVPLARTAPSGAIVMEN